MEAMSLTQTAVTRLQSDRQETTEPACLYERRSKETYRRGDKRKKAKRTQIKEWREVEKKVFFIPLQEPVSPSFLVSSLKSSILNGQAALDKKTQTNVRDKGKGLTAEDTKEPRVPKPSQGMDGKR